MEHRRSEITLAKKKCHQPEDELSRIVAVCLNQPGLCTVTPRDWKTSPGSMKLRVFLSRFDGQMKLLVRSLMCGASGADRALSVFFRQHRANPDMSLCDFLQTLCEDEVDCAEARTLTVWVKVHSVGSTACKVTLQWWRVVQYFS